MRLKELTHAVQRLLPASRFTTHFLPSRHAAEEHDNHGQVIFVIDDDNHTRERIRKMLEADGRTVEEFATCEAFLEGYRPGRKAQFQNVLLAEISP